VQIIKNRKGTFYREKIYVDGKASHSPRFNRRTDAVRWKARMEVEKGVYLSTGVLPKVFCEEETLTLEKMAETWISTRVKLQLAQRTYEHYSSTLRIHILPRFGHLKLQEIKISHGHLLIKNLLEKGHNAKGINLILGVFKRILIEATRESRLEKNPFLYLREMKETPLPDTYLSGDVINKVLGVSIGHYFNSLFLIAVNTGMRRGEIAGLCWDKVNFDTGLIEIARLRDRNGLGDRTKSYKSRRFIPMNAVVRSHLENLKRQSTSDLVVVDVNNLAFDVNHLSRDFSRFLKLAGIKEHFRFHDLRHSFASHFMMNGGNIYDLQKILGHSSLEMTQRYAHLAPEHLIQASNIVSFGANQQSRVLKAVAPI
jgi:integrase